MGTRLYVFLSKEEVSTEYNKAFKNQVEKLKKQIVKLEKNNNKLTVDLEKMYQKKKREKMANQD